MSEPDIRLLLKTEILRLEALFHSEVDDVLDALQSLNERVKILETQILLLQHLQKEDEP